MSKRLMKIDLVDRFSPILPEPLAQALIGFVCAALAVLARGAVDVIFPYAGPFALTFPFVLFATLFGRWGAGIGVMCFSALYAWYYVLPVTQSFTFEDPRDGPRVIVNVFSGFLIVLLAEYFRRFVRNVLLERDAIAEERRLLLEELDHRVKNNFTMVSAMVRMELQAAPEAAAASLRTIQGRVESIARAHESLYRGDGDIGAVAMRPYLSNLCASLNTAYFRGKNTIVADVCDVPLPRDEAVAIGLVVNELCVNASKHAFPERDDGRVEVRMVNSEEAIIVSVSDNGVGIKGEAVREGSLGQRLISAFSAQAGGSIERVDLDVGTKFQLVLPKNQAA